MRSKKPRCAVIGGANIDIGGFPEGLVAMGDSNPGRVRLSAGGVGRNIACNLARLDVETHLVTALATDAFAVPIRQDCAAAGVSLDHALTFEGETSSVYLFITDSSGDMRMAVNDMALCARLTPEALADRLSWLNTMDAVILDANLPPETLQWLGEHLEPPIIADAVSAAKVRRLLPTLPRLRSLKPNALEASALTGMPVHDDEAIAAAVRRLVAMGVQRAFVTLGEGGVCCADAKELCFIPAPAIHMVNTTGAGDAFTAALAWAELTGLNLVDSARAGLAAAALAAEAADTVSPLISVGAVTARMKTINTRRS